MLDQQPQTHRPDRQASSTEWKAEDYLDALNQEIAQGSLHEFLRDFWPYMDPSDYLDNWSTRLICEHLEAVVRGEIKRLIINIPPRHSKSLICSVAFPAWIWTQPIDPSRPLCGPDVKFMSVSYAYGLAMDHSRICRSLITSPLYQRYWGDRVMLSRDQNAKGRYDTAAQGYRLATSVDGMATGFGGDIILIDDPQDPRQASSEVERKKVIDWWSQTIQTRLNNPQTGAIIIIMQRLHHEDLTGHVLAHETGWTHLCLPARFESDHPHVFAGDPRAEGDLIWPERFPADRLAALEESLGPYTAAGQLQQRPAPREGGLFERSWFAVVSAPPAKGRMVRGWDLAGSRGKKSPYTVGVLMMRTGNEYVVVDVARAKTRPAELHRMIVNTAAQDGKRVVIDIPQDPGQAGKDQGRIIAGELSGYRVRISPETGSKETRAEPFSAQSQVGNVSLVEGAWNRAYLDELELFPNSDHSDQVDASSRAFARLAKRRIASAASGIYGVSVSA